MNIYPIIQFDIYIHIHTHIYIYIYIYIYFFVYCNIVPAHTHSGRTGFKFT